MSNLIKRFIVEESGMEMLEWAIVAVLFAVATATAFTTFSGNLSGRVTGLNTVFGN